MNIKPPSAAEENLYRSILRPLPSPFNLSKESKITIRNASLSRFLVTYYTHGAVKELFPRPLLPYRDYVAMETRDTSAPFLRQWRGYLRERNSHNSSRTFQLNFLTFNFLK